MASTSRTPELSIQVDSRIVSLLSEGTYTAFSNSLREVVVNAYDADATRVEVNYSTSPTYDGYHESEYEGELAVIDDGTGMSYSDFRRFAQIAPGRKALRSTLRYKRPRVGRFGIGFLAVFPFCETLELRSTAELSDELLIARFNCAQYFQEHTNFQNISAVPVELDVLKSDSHYYSHGTTLTLRGLSRAARIYLSPVPPHREERVGRPVYSIWDVGGSTRLRWELGQVLPIKWKTWSPEDEPEKIFGTPPSQDELDEWETLLGIERSDNDPGLTVLINEVPVRKPWPWAGDKQISQIVDPTNAETYEIVLPDTAEELPSTEDNLVGWPNKDQLFAYRVVAFSAHGAIQPLEMRGVQLRLRGVGIDTPLPFSNLPNITKISSLRRVSVEVHLVEGFDESITIDRSELKQTPWVRAMMRSLKDKILRFALSFGQAELQAEKTVKEINEGKHRYSPNQIRSRAERLAESMGYEIGTGVTAKVDHADRRIVLPASIPEPRVTFMGKTIRLAADDSDLLKKRLTRYLPDQGVILISRRLYDHIEKWGVQRRSELINLILVVDEVIAGWVSRLPVEESKFISMIEEGLGPVLKARILESLTNRSMT